MSARASRKRGYADWVLRAPAIAKNASAKHTEMVNAAEMNERQCRASQRRPTCTTMLI